jgi:hypothetical protein
MVLPEMLLCMTGCQWRESTQTYTDYWKNSSCCPCLNAVGTGTGLTMYERRGIEPLVTGAHTFHVSTQAQYLDQLPQIE